jgi:CxxC motif-containing protein
MEITCVLEKLPYCSGLTRNVRQCLTDYEIPLELSTTVVELIGDGRLTAVVAAKVDAFGEPIPETRRVIHCDTLILSVGLIPENELAKICGVLINPQTGGALVDARLMTSIPGVFSCGNGLHVHDIVDMVSAEAETAAQNAVRYLHAGSAEERQISLIAAPGIKYVLPPSISENTAETVALRVQAPGRVQSIVVTQAEKVIAKKNMRRLSPAEMIRISLPSVSAENGDLCVTLLQEPVSADSAEISLICICCPNGCALFPEQGGDGTLQIKGALCPRGISYAIGELNDPIRTLTTTVRIDNARYPLLPVRSREPVKKGELPRFVKELRDVRLTAPIRCGEQIPFEGANIIASCTAATKEKS